MQKKVHDFFISNKTKAEKMDIAKAKAAKVAENAALDTKVMEEIVFPYFIMDLYVNDSVLDDVKLPQDPDYKKAMAPLVKKYPTIENHMDISVSQNKPDKVKLISQDGDKTFEDPDYKKAMAPLMKKYPKDAYLKAISKEDLAKIQNDFQNKQKTN